MGFVRPADHRQASEAPLRAIARDLGVPIPRRVAAELRRAMIVPVRGDILLPGATALLRTVKRLGLRSVLVSNTALRDAEDYHEDFERHGVADTIDAIVTSVDVGFRKPHPSMFIAALQAARCDAARAVMIGNSERADVEPAIALGLRAIPDRSAAHAVAGSLKSAGDILGAWAS
jgi:putative hydrolase of the HAD superfamily